jgi:hypothetical protein
VRLQAQHSQPDVEPAQSQRHERVRARLARLGSSLGRAESAVVDLEGNSENREGEESEREEDIEVEKEVGKVEGWRLGAVKIGRAAGGGEEVVEDDIEGGECGLAVSVRVDESDGDLLMMLRALGQLAAPNRNQSEAKLTKSRPEEPSDSPAHLFVRITAQHILSSDKQLLRDEGHGEQESERPSEDGSEGEEEGSEVDPSSGAFSVRRSWLEVEGVGEEGGVHSGCRRKEG